MSTTATKKRLVINQGILQRLKEAQEAADMDPDTCRLDRVHVEAIRNYMNSWVRGPLREAIKLIERKGGV